jgi:hypothetical protein
MKVFFLSTLIVLFFACIQIGSLLFGEDIDVKKAISIIKIKEANVRSFEWKCNVERHSLEKKEKDLGHSHVYLDKQGRFRVDSTFVSPWIDGVTPFLYNQQRITFDGKILRSEEAEMHLHSETEDVQKIEKSSLSFFGEISQGYNVTNTGINWRGAPVGAGYFFPFTGAWDGVDGLRYFPPLCFSDVLQELVKQKKVVQITENDAGVWDITYPFYLVPENNIQIYCKVQYNPGNGDVGTINAVWRGTEDDLKDKDLPPFISFEYQVISNFFVPQKVNILVDVDKDGKPSKYDVYTFTDVKVNEVLSPLDFLIDWQRGTNVYDYVTEQFYVVTGDPIDEAESVKAFKRIHGLVPDPTISNNSPFWLLRMALLLLAILLVAYCIYRYFRRRV